MGYLKQVLLGFEIGTGKPIHIHEHHLFISGMTRLSGKTTTLEALVARSGKRAITFRTKRGEIGFDEAHRIPPFYVERADWRYVQELIEATMREKVRFERYWVIRACKNASSLGQVQSNVRSFLKREKLRELDRSVFTNIDAYLDIIVPQIDQIKPSNALDLVNGVNVMDIVGLTVEMQSLIIRATLEQVLTKLENTIVVMPEAWKFMPQTLGNPVKRTAEHFIREGGSVGNYLWIDSQDLVGIDKRILRSVDIWIMGRQKETHEVEAVLDVIPLPKGALPKPEEIQTLPIGYFVAVIGDNVHRVYVQPNWLDEETARRIAKGEIRSDQADVYAKKPTPQVTPTVEAVMPEIERVYSEFRDLKDRSLKGEKQLQELSDNVHTLNQKIEKPSSTVPSERTMFQRQALLDFNMALNERIDKVTRRLEKLEAQPQAGGKSPQTLQLEAEELSVEVTHTEVPLKLSTSTGLGKIMYVVINDLKGNPSTESEISKVLTEEYGWGMGHSTLAPNIGKLVKDGFLVKTEDKPSKYRPPRKIKIIATREAM